MKWRKLLACACGLLLLMSAANADDDQDNPLNGFERLIGGRWQLDNSYQTFEWGVGRQSVVSRSFTQTLSGDKLVSEGLWFYHPGDQVIHGIFTAIEMGTRLFEYQTRFEGDAIVSKLVTWDNEQQRGEWEERWTFTDEKHYIWELFDVTGDQRKNVMRGVFVRYDP
jgi:hypothetical protein